MVCRYMLENIPVIYLFIAELAYYAVVRLRPSPVQDRYADITVQSHASVLWA